MGVYTNLPSLRCLLIFPLNAACGVLTQAYDSVLAGNNVVDLGYQLNQGRIVNESLITFRNIRYAAAPVDSLRFQAPTPPPTNRSAIQDHPDVIAPQAYPSWFLTGATNPVSPGDIPPADPRTSEDCLFLDVLMSASIWEARQTSKAPVLVWIHGGGFDLGWKDASGRGEGLVLRSPRNGTQGVILVSVNYRLGLFGWMHGSGVTSNAGLLDQRFALDWVQEYIGLFGGDKDHVTILGESAGGSSAIAHVTAYGGSKGPVPFVGAIPQSPYQAPKYPPPSSSLDAILKYANLTSLEELQATSTEELQELNALIIGNAKPFGSFVFGIIVDGDYVPNLPNKLLLEGRFDKNLSIMTGRNQDEGSRFVPNSQVTNETAYEDFLQAFFPPLQQQPEQLQLLTQELYPPDFSGAQGYTSQAQRNNLTFADALSVCNTRALNAAVFGPQGYAYEYTAPPAVHGADLAYTFYEAGNVTGVNSTAAVVLQRYITNFAQTGDPNGAGLPLFPPTRKGETVQNIGVQGIGPMPDEGGVQQINQRCLFWQKAPYLTEYST